MLSNSQMSQYGVFCTMKIVYFLLAVGILIHADICVIREKVDDDGISKWAIGFYRRCDCTSVLAPVQHSVYLDDHSSNCVDRPEPQWWFIDNVDALIRRDNWNPARLDVLLDRGDFCVGIASQQSTTHAGISSEGTTNKATTITPQESTTTDGTTVAESTSSEATTKADTISIQDTTALQDTTTIQDDINECSSNPCQNTGECIDQFEAYECICARGFLGHTCEIDCRTSFLGDAGLFLTSTKAITASDIQGRVGQTHICLKSYHPWILVDLQSLHIVTGFQVEWSPDVPVDSGDHVVTSARVKVGNDANTLTYIADDSGNPKIFGTRKQSSNIADVFFDSVVTTQFIRIEPLSVTDTRPPRRCLMVDVLACPDTSQHIPQFIGSEFPFTLVGPFETTEGDGTLDVTITRTCTVCDQTATISISADDWTALSTLTITTTKPDFTKITNQVVNFAAGEAQKVVTLDILDDDIPEADEQFVIYIAEHDGIDKSGAFNLITIHDDDLVDGCSAPLGFEWQTIADDQLTASASISAAKVPEKARMNHYSCWRSSSQYDTGQMWWQVDLVSVTRISGLVIQGSPYPIYQLWVKTFRVQYKDSGGSMVFIKDGSVNKVFTANTDDLTPVVVYFDQPIDTSIIRLDMNTCTLDIPGYMQCSMRLELLGCNV